MRNILRRWCAQRGLAQPPRRSALPWGGVRRMPLHFLLESLIGIFPKKFLKKSCLNIWSYQIKFLPLHRKTGAILFANGKGAIAQLVEQRTENPCVPGSIPGGTTCKTPKCFNIKRFGVFRFSRLRWVTYKVTYKAIIWSCLNRLKSSWLNTIKNFLLIFKLIKAPIKKASHSRSSYS